MASEGKHKYRAIVIGVSSGGIEALKKILPELPANFPLPIIIVQHQHPNSDNYFAEYMNEKCRMRVKEADEKESIAAGTIYFAPPNYHLLIEADETFALSTSERVCNSRPSIDVLFETAADVYESSLIGIILTGANSDGANGMKRIKENGGLSIVQDPKTAESPTMPRAAIKACKVDHVLTLEKIPKLLMKILMKKKSNK